MYRKNCTQIREAVLEDLFSWEPRLPHISKLASSYRHVPVLTQLLSTRPCLDTTSKTNPLKIYRIEKVKYLFVLLYLQFHCVPENKQIQEA